MKKNRSIVLICLLWITILSHAVLWYSLSAEQTQVVHVAGKKIVAVAQESSVEKTDLLQLMTWYYAQRKFTEAQMAIREELIDYILSERTTTVEFPQWSIQEMKQKLFVWSNLMFEEVLDVNSSYTRYRISYMSNWLSISGIMNIPTGEWPFPLVILNHGYIDPRVYTVWRWLKREQDYLARNWYVVLHTDYRNHGLSDVSWDLNENYYFRSYFYGTDSINAINAVKDLWDSRIDTNKVAMMWHSMWGGVTMHSILAQPNLIDAAVLYAPVHTRERENFERWRREDLSQAELEVLAQKIWPIDQDDSFAPYSPYTYLDEISIPLQYYHGTNDADVPYDRSVEAVQKLQITNANVDLITFEWEWHEFGFRWNDFMEWVVVFLDSAVK